MISAYLLCKKKKTWGVIFSLVLHDVFRYFTSIWIHCNDTSWDLASLLSTWTQTIPGENFLRPWRQGARRLTYLERRLKLCTRTIWLWNVTEGCSWIFKTFILTNPRIEDTAPGCNIGTTKCTSVYFINVLWVHFFIITLDNLIITVFAFLELLCYFQDSSGGRQNIWGAQCSKGTLRKNKKSYISLKNNITPNSRFYSYSQIHQYVLSPGARRHPPVTIPSKGIHTPSQLRATHTGFDLHGQQRGRHQVRTHSSPRIPLSAYYGSMRWILSTHNLFYYIYSSELSHSAREDVILGRGKYKIKFLKRTYIFFLNVPKYQSKGALLAEKTHSK